MRSTAFIGYRECGQPPEGLTPTGADRRFMASETATSPGHHSMAASAADEGFDRPLLDLSDDAVQAMIKRARARGFVTHGEINAVLPSSEVTSERIEDILAMLHEMGINAVEQDDGESEDAANGEAPADGDNEGELVE